MEAMAATGSKKHTKRMVREIVSSITLTLPKELLGGVSTAAHVTTFADRVAFVKTLQQHQEEFDQEDRPE